MSLSSMPGEILAMMIPPHVNYSCVSKEWKTILGAKITALFVEVACDNVDERMKAAALRFPNLKHLDCSDTCARNIGCVVATYFPSLESIVLNDTNIQSLHFREIPSILPRLKCIGVVNCAMISWSSLGYVAKTYPDLKIVHERQRPTELWLPNLTVSIRCSHAAEPEIASPEFLVFFYTFLMDLSNGVFDD